MTSAPAPRAGLLQLRGVSKRHGLVQSLHEVDLDLPRGEVVALVGPPGAGKTTLCRAIHGAERIDSGEILLDGAPLATGARGRVRRTARADVGLVPPPETVEHALVTALGALGLGRTVFGELTRCQVEVRGTAPELAAERTLEALRLVDADHESSLRSRQLTPAVRGRVALARALVLDPKVLVLDEPAEELHCLARELASDGRTMLIVTEDQGFAHATADRVLFMSGGRIVESAPPEQFFSAPRTSRARDFVSRLRRR
ncbi:ATP-binding cassette domain-containing protein [Streptacidiphilus neutrinimicus]|uniref:ATP-binding cassette domain-containing protein n=1 Tax=Streptacidiphilus neutrinimicus TaxID=105420 RepID=UPI0005AB0529|nr:ATP-binding cassette domain-containing protein [Streptacidiphilus neutrinimicus]